MANPVSNISIRRVPISIRKDPLDDFTTLKRIAKLATKTARARAFQNGAYIVVTKKRVTYKIFPDGRKEIIKEKSENSIPRIEDDLCLA